MHVAIKERHALMDDDTPLPFELSVVPRKKVTAAFDGGRLSSDGGVLLLRGVERRLGPPPDNRHGV
jgi:hypothetical protein